MNISISDFEIINLENVICVRRFGPGEKIPYSEDRSTQWPGFVIWFQFSTIVTKSIEPKPAMLFFHFVNEREWNSAWAEINSLMETRELSWLLKTRKDFDDNK